MDSQSIVTRTFRGFAFFSNSRPCLCASCFQQPFAKVCFSPDYRLSRPGIGITPFSVLYSITMKEGLRNWCFVHFCSFFIRSLCNWPNRHRSENQAHFERFLMAPNTIFFPSLDTNEEHVHIYTYLENNKQKPQKTDHMRAPFVFRCCAGYKSHFNTAEASCSADMK